METKENIINYLSNKNENKIKIKKELETRIDLDEIKLVDILTPEFFQKEVEVNAREGLINFYNFLRVRLGYSIAAINGYDSKAESISNSKDKEVTLKSFFQDIIERNSLDEKFVLNGIECTTLEKFIDFENSEFRIREDIDLSNKEKEIITRFSKSKVEIDVNQSSLYQTYDLEWLKKIKNLKLYDTLDGENLDIDIDEFINRRDLFKEYTTQNHKNFFYAEDEYRYFIKNEYIIENLKDIDELKNKQEYLKSKGLEVPKAKLRINSYLAENIDEIRDKIDLREYDCEILLPKRNIKLTYEDIQNIEKLEKEGINIPNLNDKKISLSCDVISQVNEEIINKYNIKAVTIGENENSNSKPLSIHKYRRIRYELDNIVEDIPKDASEQEKFKIVYERLANKLTYDYEAIIDETEYAKENTNKCRNLENGVLLGKCVCAGYAEILKQTLSLVGIESKYVSSKENPNDNISHAYNLVKIDNKWYNADLTWDYESLRENMQPKYCLKSDRDFIDNVSDEEEKYYHTPENEELPKCKESLNIFKEKQKHSKFKLAKSELKSLYKEYGIKGMMKNFINNLKKRRITERKVQANSINKESIKEASENAEPSKKKEMLGTIVGRASKNKDKAQNNQDITH